MPKKETQAPERSGAINAKKVQAFDLLRKINALMAAARQLQGPLAKVESEIAELEKSDRPETPKEEA